MFRPGDSLVYRVHPVVKLAWLVWAVIAVFAFDSTILPVAAAGLAAALLRLSGVRLREVPGARLWSGLLVMVVAVQVVGVRAGDPVLGPVTVGGLLAGARAGGRLAAVVLLSALFVATTEPYALACGLMRLGLPCRWGFALVTALRLAPLFRLEAHQAYRAQLVRGVAHDARGPRRWWLRLRYLSLPLLISALRTAQALSLSMEGRGFGSHRRRTFMRQVVFGWRDVGAVVVLLISVGLGVWCTLWPV